MFSFNLNDAEKIVLFEICNKITESNVALDEAEEKLINNLIVVMEKSLVEPFSSDYKAIIEKAKKAILDN